MSDYRWNRSAFAASYDAGAAAIHPYYDEIHDTIVGLLPFAADDEFLFVDAAGGSGRLAEKFLRRFPRASALVFDQSEPMLALAAERLAQFGPRGRCAQARLQDDWTRLLDGPAGAVVSTSAIHHLEPEEKRALYARAFAALGPGGVLLNGDEVRPESDEEYLHVCRRWTAQKRERLAAGIIPAEFRTAIDQWEERNVRGFGQPRASGDDCHETAAAQLGYFREAGFAVADVPWQRELWAVLRGVKGP
jgi:tRNA (cmo5U34)-methyltransferase